MSLISSVLTPGLVAAAVTVVLYVWIQRARADLQMVKINETVEVAKWLALAGKDDDPAAEEAMKHWQAQDIVLLTNYGDGTAYDIRLSGSRSPCRPRVFVRHMGREETEGVVAVAPIWSDRLGALGAGEMISVVVMSDPTLPRPVLEVSWSRLPSRLPKCLKHTRLGRKKRSYDLASARALETGWPGKSVLTA